MPSFLLSDLKAKFIQRGCLKILPQTCCYQLRKLQDYLFTTPKNGIFEACLASVRMGTVWIQHSSEEFRNNHLKNIMLTSVKRQVHGHQSVNTLICYLSILKIQGLQGDLWHGNRLSKDEYTRKQVKRNLGTLTGVHRLRLNLHQAHTLFIQYLGGPC